MGQAKLLAKTISDGYRDAWRSAIPDIKYDNQYLTSFSVNNTAQILCISYK